jgi:hypothetical protein
MGVESARLYGSLTITAEARRWELDLCLAVVLAPVFYLFSLCCALGYCFGAVFVNLL